MVSRSRGYRSKTRHKLKKSVRGMPPVNRFLQEFEIGEKVSIILDSSITKGMPHPRFHGRVGTVTGKRGRAYLIKLKDIKKEKIFISLPVHLRRV
ncbi:MAG: 50S ribosomal protein L21e [Candidatus Altiarchaeota archaeon]|nr:50S ribosomal protein L21e [Candidatus Altiarchaeota archaeon]